MDDDYTCRTVDATIRCVPSPHGCALRAGICVLCLVLFGAGAAADTLDGLYDTSWGSGGTVHFAGDPSLFANRALTLPGSRQRRTIRGTNYRSPTPCTASQSASPRTP